MSTHPDPASGEDLRTETRLNAHTLVVHYRAPEPGHALREAYDRAITEAEHRHITARREPDDAAGEKAA